MDVMYGVNVPKSDDPLKMTEMEMKHAVSLDVLEFDREKGEGTVCVEVGKHMKHPCEPSHFIQWVELYVDDTLTARVDLTASLAYPKVVFRVKLRQNSTLLAKARCNLHGTWMSRRKYVQS